MKNSNVRKAQYLYEMCIRDRNVPENIYVITQTNVGERAKIDKEEAVNYVKKYW